MFHFLDRAPFGSSRGSYEILDLNFQQLFLMKEWTYELCQLFCIDYEILPISLTITPAIWKSLRSLYFSCRYIKNFENAKFHCVEGEYGLNDISSMYLACESRKAISMITTGSWSIHYETYSNSFSTTVTHPSNWHGTFCRQHLTWVGKRTCKSD